jgi:hypothetical protein
MVVVFCLVAACAATAENSSNYEIWVSGAGGFNGYSHSDVNDELKLLTDELGIASDEVNSGFAVQGELGLLYKSSFSFGVGMKRFHGSAQISDFSGSITYTLPANATYAVVGYTFPSQSKFSYGAAVAFGTISSKGKLVLAVTGLGSGTGYLDGSGTFIEGRLTTGYRLTPALYLNPVLGYRLAEIDEIKIDGITQKKLDDSNWTLDYSGFTAQIGFTLYLGR